MRELTRDDLSGRFARLPFPSVSANVGQNTGGCPFLRGSPSIGLGQPQLFIQISEEVLAIFRSHLRCGLDNAKNTEAAIR